MTRPSLLVLDQTIPYSIRESTKAKRLRVAVYVDGEVIVTKPKGTSVEKLLKFVESKKLWVAKKLEQNTTVGLPELMISSEEHFAAHREAAKSLVLKKTKKWSKKIGCEYGSIEIKQLKSRWGSCSSSGSLSFNYKILFLPEKLQDYVIVHELCHLRHQDHSKNFWTLIAVTLPDYKSLHTAIKRM